MHASSFEVELFAGQKKCFGWTRSGLQDHFTVNLGPSLGSRFDVNELVNLIAKLAWNWKESTAGHCSSC